MSEPLSSETPRTGRGGYRPGAGRKPTRPQELPELPGKPATSVTVPVELPCPAPTTVPPPATAAPALDVAAVALPRPLIPDVADLVWFWEAGISPRGLNLVPRAALVLSVAYPGEPESPLSLTVFGVAATTIRHAVPFSATPLEGAWSWPAKVRAAGGL